MTKRVVIFGTGSLAQLMHAHLRDDSDYDVAAFTVTGDRMAEASLSGCPVVPFETLPETHPSDDYEMFIAIGYSQMNRQRSRFYNEAKMRGYKMATYVASTIRQRPPLRVGDNSCVLDGSIIEPFAAIGNDVVVWGGSYIGHHTTIGDHSFLAPRVAIAGHVTIGSHCFLGINSTVRDGIVIGDDGLIGAGATVLDNTAPGAVYITSRTKPYAGDARRFFE